MGKSLYTGDLKDACFADPPKTDYKEIFDTESKFLQWL